MKKLVILVMVLDYFPHCVIPTTDTPPQGIYTYNIEVQLTTSFADISQVVFESRSIDDIVFPPAS